MLSKTLTASQLSFGNDEPPKEGHYTAKTRYRMTDAKCYLKYIDNESINLIFDEPQWAITPGQSVVLYTENICLGGGIIDNN